jgi:hypothetical protein
MVSPPYRGGGGFECSRDPESYALRYEDVRQWRYSSTSLDLDSRCGPASRPGSFALVKEPRYPLDMMLGEPQSRSGRCGVEKNFSSIPGIENRPCSS